jgi:hypothetical protein
MDEGETGIGEELIITLLLIFLGGGWGRKDGLWAHHVTSTVYVAISAFGAIFMKHYTDAHTSSDFLHQFKKTCRRREILRPKSHPAHQRLTQHTKVSPSTPKSHQAHQSLTHPAHLSFTKHTKVSPSTPKSHPANQSLTQHTKFHPAHLSFTKHTKVSPSTPKFHQAHQSLTQHTKDSSQRGRNMQMINHVHLVKRLWMSGTLTPPSWYDVKLTLSSYLWSHGGVGV